MIVATEPETIEKPYQLTNDWIGKNIAEEVASLAEENLKENGFVFIEEAGLYYDSNNNCYYNPECRMYYYVDNKAYYYYDEGSGSLKFHSYPLEGVDEDQEPCEMEEERLPEAPCLRIVLQSSGSANESIGKAFVVTCYGASLGREGTDLEISLPDELVSKVHCVFHCRFSDGQYCYEVQDAGSKNGTFLNGQQLRAGVPAPLSHGSLITVGSTQLLCHLHLMYETCPECCLDNVAGARQDLSKQTEYCLRSFRSELSRLRKKFGLSRYVPTNFPPNYADRAETRRIVKGSSCEFEKTEAASVDIPIPSNNRGYILLKKMGWKEDQSVG